MAQKHHLDFHSGYGVHPLRQRAYLFGNALSMGAGLAERAAKDKFSHAQVAYEHPAKGEDHCGECQHYIEKPERCEIVRNPIRAEDWCRKFKEKY